MSIRWAPAKSSRVRALKEYARRDEIVLATKLYYKMREGPNGSGLSRKAVFQELDASLRRLGTDYVDLYQIHRWDDSTPIEETLDALNDVVRAGEGALHRRLIHVCLAVCTGAGDLQEPWWAKFVSMQNFVNLIYREEEREMFASVQG